MAFGRNEEKDRKKDIFSRESETLNIKETTLIVTDIIQNKNKIGNEAENNSEIIKLVMAGDIKAKKQIVNIIEDLLVRLSISVENMSRLEAAYDIYKYAWGLGPIEEIYNNPDVNEIRVNGPNQVYGLVNGQNVKFKVSFKDNEHINNIIRRMFIHDRGVGLNRSNPTLESMRLDGTRITATCPPVTKNVTLALRKHTPKVLTKEELLQSETINDFIWEIFEVLTKGRANVLIAGGVGTGKTTTLRTLFGLTSPNARTIVLETDSELLLSDHFPERDIVEFESHPEASSDLSSLFRISLRYSPNLIIMGEFRGTGEARQAVEACTRGHDGSMATAHFSSPKEAVDGTARLLLGEGFNVPPEVAISTVASAFNVVLQMFGDSTRGIIKVDKISEIVVDGFEVEYRDLLKWVPYAHDYSQGEWRSAQKPSERLIDRLKKHGISNDQFKKLNWI